MNTEQEKADNTEDRTGIIIGGVLFPLAIGIAFGVIAISTAWSQDTLWGIGVLAAILTGSALGAYIALKRKGLNGKINTFIKKWGLLIGVALMVIAAIIAATS